ncbi:MAG: FAD:protein FMN transferase [Sulfurimonas sp.]|nr:FAD:protein FMN transferase [Sulfurimonas sp.]
MWGLSDNNHLINPKTKESQKSFISLTLISTLPNSDIDAYATAASVMPKELAYRFLNSLDVGYIINGRVS